jgi:hypothetical protein
MTVSNVSNIGESGDVVPLTSLLRLPQLLALIKRPREWYILTEHVDLVEAVVVEERVGVMCEGASGRVVLIAGRVVCLAPARLDRRGRRSYVFSYRAAIKYIPKCGVVRNSAPKMLFVVKEIVSSRECDTGGGWWACCMRR